MMTRQINKLRRAPCPLAGCLLTQPCSHYLLTQPCSLCVQSQAAHDAENHQVQLKVN